MPGIRKDPFLVTNALMPPAVFLFRVFFFPPDGINWSPFAH
jgi:hypothetical protein